MSEKNNWRNDPIVIMITAGLTYLFRGMSLTNTTTDFKKNVNLDKKTISDVVSGQA